jgi:hypothetical protein
MVAQHRQVQVQAALHLLGRAGVQVAQPQGGGAADGGDQHDGGRQQHLADQAQPRQAKLEPGAWRPNRIDRHRALPA